MTDNFNPEDHMTPLTPEQVFLAKEALGTYRPPNFVGYDPDDQSAANHEAERKTRMTYQSKKESRKQRLEKRITTLRAFAKGKDLSLYHESRSGIPMGQPILVGHHSERRHRRHLERIENIIRKGFDAAKKADQLEQRLRSMEHDKSIQIDNPDAGQLIRDKITLLETTRDKMKLINKEYKSNGGNLSIIPMEDDLRREGQSVLRVQAYYKCPFPPYMLTNTGAEIRRLKKRLIEVQNVRSNSFNAFGVGIQAENGGGLIGVELVDGQLQIEYPWKPSEESRAQIKALAFKWSRYSERWVRKHTGTTASPWFREELIRVLKQAKK